MVENRPWLTFLSHAMLILGVVVVAFPLYVTFVASTLTLEQIMHGADAAPAGRPARARTTRRCSTAGSTKGSKAAVSHDARSTAWSWRS